MANDPDPDRPRRSADFKEVAREIVASDRFSRRYGGASHITTNIARALERAYQRGRRDASGTGPAKAEPAVLRWIDVPPRARGALETLCRYGFGTPAEPLFNVALTQEAQSPIFRAAPVWHVHQIHAPEDPKRRRVEALGIQFGAATLAPLFRLGLLELENSNLACLSAEAYRIWEEDGQHG